MAFKVFENNIPCSECGINGWDFDTFDNFNDAIIFAHQWCYPTTFNTIDDCPHKMEINVPIDMSMCEFPVMMKIEVVNN